MPLNHPWRSSLVEVEKSAEKAAEIASDLASLVGSRKRPLQSSGNLNQVLRTVELYQVPGIHKVHWTLQLEKCCTRQLLMNQIQQALTKILITPSKRLEKIARSNHDCNKSLAEPALQGTLMLLHWDYMSKSQITPRYHPILPRISNHFSSPNPAPWTWFNLGLWHRHHHGGTVTVAAKVGRTTVGLYLPARKRS